MIAVPTRSPTCAASARSESGWAGADPPLPDVAKAVEPAASKATPTTAPARERSLMGLPPSQGDGRRRPSEFLEPPAGRAATPDRRHDPRKTRRIRAAGTGSAYPQTIPPLENVIDND